MPKVSVIIPLYNAEKYIAETLHCVLNQTYADFEIIVVDDGSHDRGVEICRSLMNLRLDSRIEIIQQSNRGLAGARNTGIRASRGDYLAFLDADDLWANTKLEQHVRHLDHSPHVGISFDYSEFINDQSLPLGLYQKPKHLHHITPEYILCRNPIGNGSAAVVRRSVCEAMRYRAVGDREDSFFDEHLPTKQAEDVEFWLRVVLTSHWTIEGLPEVLTFYRISNGGLSANALRQLEALQDVMTKTRTYAPDMIAGCERNAHAYHLRYTARRMVTLGNGKQAVSLIHRSLRSDWRILLEEPWKTLLTAVAAYLMRYLPVQWYRNVEALAMDAIARPSSIGPEART